MRRVHATGSLLCLSLLAACGGNPPPPAKPINVASAASVAPPPPPPPTRARWVFSYPENGLVGKADAGDAGTLYVGGNGRRALVKGDGPMVDAPTLALEDLIGVVRDDKGRFVFVARDGDVFTAKEPLGDLGEARPGPLPEGPVLQRLGSPTTGKVAIMGISPADQKLWRTSDFGVTWKPVDYAGPSKPYGRPVAVQLDGKGGGLLLHFPQRLFVTSDDGGTWTPVTSPGIGARRLIKDGAGKIFLHGASNKRAKLEGGKLVLSTDPIEPVYKPPTKTARSFDERTEILSRLAGDRLVEMTLVVPEGKRVGELTVRSVKLGDRFGDKDKGAVAPDLASRSMSELVAGHGADLLYLRKDVEVDADTGDKGDKGDLDLDRDEDEDAKTTTLFVSRDHGATWKKDATLDGVRPREDGEAHVVAGPKGWAYVTGLCPHDASSGSSCGHRQIRPAGAAAFEDMVFSEEFAPAEFAFDEARDKVYALGVKDDTKHVYESPLSRNKFTRTKVLDVSDGTPTAMTVDAKGTLRVFQYLAQSSPKVGPHWVLQRRDAEGKELPKLHLSMDRGTMAFAGARGLLFAHDRAWETDDGGESWIRVAKNGQASDLACTDAGCVNGGAQRAGWDLPVMRGQEKTTAQAEPPKFVPVASPQRTPDPPAPPPRMELVCKPAGAATPIAQVPGTELLDGRVPEARWGSIKRGDDGKVSIVVGSKTAVRELGLLGPQPKDVKNGPEYRHGDRVMPEGIVAARYSFAPKSTTGTFNPVDVELAWWSAATGKVSRHTLAKMKPFKVSRYGFNGTPQIVDGGLLFQTAYGEPVHFIKEDGKVETLALPSAGALRTALRAGKRWILSEWDRGLANLTWSDDNGATWTQRAWGLDEYGGSMQLTLLGTKPAMTVAHPGMPTLLFPLDGAIPDDPPAPVVATPSQSDTVCDAQAARGRITANIPFDRRGGLKMRIDPLPAEKDKAPVLLNATTRVSHDTASGKPCTAAYLMSGAQTAFLYPEAKGAWSAWRFVRATAPAAPGKAPAYSAEPMTCAPVLAVASATTRP